eukprot:4232592-Prorocentrum_lima.AAC.1
MSTLPDLLEPLERGGTGTCLPWHERFRRKPRACRFHRWHPQGESRYTEGNPQTTLTELGTIETSLGT